MIRAATYRPYPGTLRQAQFLARIAGANRYVWNWAIGLNDDQMRIWKEDREEKPSVNFFQLGLESTASLNSAGHEWLRELPFEAVRYTLKRYADAMREAVRGRRSSWTTSRGGWCGCRRGTRARPATAAGMSRRRTDRPSRNSDACPAGTWGTRT